VVEEERVFGDEDAPEVDMARRVLVVEGDEDHIEAEGGSRLDEVDGVAMAELKLGKGEGYSAYSSAIELRRI
jgi:hypothetical protein